MAAVRSCAVARFGSSAAPSPPDSRSAATANWSVEKGSATTGSPAWSASITVLFPPWQMTTSQARKAAIWGRRRRTIHPWGSGPSSSGGVTPEAITAWKPAVRSPSAIRLRTSERAERKLPSAT